MIDVTVKYKGKKYIVRFSDAGEPRAIKRRKLYSPGKPYEAWYNSTYWHHSAKIGKPGSIAYEVLKLAREQGHIPNKETREAILESRALRP